MPKRRVKYSSRSAFWPCRDCRGNCVQDSVKCEACNGWYHYTCQNLTLADIEYVCMPQNPYSCTECFTKEVGVYTYDSSLQRLRMAAESGYQSLLFAARREAKIMPNNQIPEVETVDPQQLYTDYVTRTIMTNLNMKQGTPKLSSPDGNCLFNAISTALYGHETMCTEIRTRTCIQMCLNETRYLNRPDARDITLISPSFAESAIDCAISHSSSSVWTMIAAADALAIAINSIYPPVNGINDIAFKTLNAELKPTTVWAPIATVNIMWTNTSITTNHLRVWTPNHFVPVFDDFNSTFSNSFMPEYHSSPMRNQTEIPPTIDVEDLTTTYDANTFSSTEESQPTEPTEHDHESTDVNDAQPTEPTEHDDVNDTQPTEPTEHDHESTDVNDTQPTEVNDEHSTSNNFPRAININNLENGRFMSTFEIWTAIEKKERVFDSAPPGEKSNSWFLVQNANNILQRSRNKKSDYYDDCGVWDSSKGKVFHQDHLLSDNFRLIYKKEDQYCLRVRQKGKSVFIPLSPQPPSSDIVTLHRYSTSLKRKPDFKKHVSWFTSPENRDLSSIALYEYSGQYPPPNPENTEYIRTHPSTMTKIRESCKTQGPKDIYINLNREDSFSAPRDTKQIRNAKYRAAKENNSVKNNNNIADEILHVVGILDDHPLVQQIVHTKKQVPSIICYTEDQMTDMKQFLSQKTDNPIGVDRTFNLGKFFVTAMVYKNLRVVRKETKDHPIFLGPMLLHKDASYHTYRAFFSHVSAHLAIDLDNIELRLDEKIEFGSDDEKAMTRAIEHSFPDAKRRLCTKHIKDNVKHYLQNKIGVNSNERNEIMSALFSDDGLANADDTLCFETASRKVKDIAGKYPKFIEYFERHLKPRIKDFVTEPNQRIDNDKLWTNNNAESMNRVMKVSTNWKPRSTPDLINKLHDIVEFQYINLRAALHSSGDYKLCLGYQQYVVSDVAWKTKSKEEKDRIFKNFLCNQKKRKPAEEKIESTNGTYKVVNKAARIATKPGQTKRARCERSKKK